MHRPYHYLGVGLVLAWGAACGSPASADGVAAANNLATMFTEAFCANQLRCCSTQEISALGGRYTTEEECVASSAGVSARQQLALAGLSIRAGRMRIDWTRADECLALYRERACSSPQAMRVDFTGPLVAEWLSRCPGVLVGLVQAGERCALAGECAPGSHCIFPPAGSGADGGASSPLSTDPAAPSGVCMAFQAAGQPCTSNGDCDRSAGQTCRFDDLRCGATDASDAVCNPDGDPALECDINAGMACDFGTRTCKRLPREGEPCIQFTIAACDPNPAWGLSCVGVAVNGTGTCVRPAAEGESCGARALPFCGAQLYCRSTQADGIGVCAPLLDEGAPCAGASCRLGLACDPVSLTCRVPGPKPGAARCANDSECVSLFCDMSSGPGPGTCVFLGAVTCSGGGGRTQIGGGGVVDGGFPVLDARPPPTFDAAVDQAQGEGGFAFDAATDGAAPDEAP